MSQMVYAEKFGYLLLARRSVQSKIREPKFESLFVPTACYIVSAKRRIDGRNLHGSVLLGVSREYRNIVPMYCLKDIYSSP